MLKRVLLTLALALFQVACTFSEERGSYKPAEISWESRQGWERLKRNFLELQDLKIGDGPVAAWGRKVEADIEVRYAGTNDLVYRGPAIAYFGLKGSVFIHNNVFESGMLSRAQTGIILGLNGMAVGGKRRISIHPKLVCERRGEEGANPNANCLLVLGKRENVKVRKVPLIVEATVTASCIPVFIDIPLIYHGQFRCRDSDSPKRDPDDPIWQFY